MKYIKTYSDNAAYEADKPTMLAPHVGYIEATDEVKYVNDWRELHSVHCTLSNSETNWKPYVQVNIIQFDSTKMRWTKLSDESFGFDWFGNDVINTLTFASRPQNSFVSIDGINMPTSQASAITFNGNSELIYLDLSGIDTQSVTNMKNMFRYCQKLKTINCSDFITSGVTTMEYMFNNCSVLETINISNFDMTNVSATTSMFYGCSALTTITMNNTNQTTFDKIKSALNDYTPARNKTTIIRDGHSYQYQNGQWVEV